MQQDNKKQSILSKPSFKRLVHSRNKWRFALTALAVLCHAFFVGGVTFYRDLFAMPISQGSTMTLGIVFTALVIVLFIVLEFVYIAVSEKKLDPMQASVAAELAEDD